MNVTIIGAGNMGWTIGHVLIRGGHSVMILDRDPEEAEQLTKELRSAAQGDATVEAAGPVPSLAVLRVLFDFFRVRLTTEG